MKIHRMLLSLLCLLAFWVGLFPVSAATAPGGDFAYTDSKQPMLIEQILQRDGLIDGIWMPWFEGMTGSHSLTANDVMVRYYGDGWATVAMDTLGADQVYRNIYNLKAMGYNLLGYGGSLYDEGVVLDAYGDVLGVKQEYLDKYRADCMTPGNRVQLITPASRQEAFAVEVDDQFRLVVELPDGTRKALSTGEVSVRGMYGYV